MARNLDLFGKPRRPPRVLMHLCAWPLDGEKLIVRYKCKRCGYLSDWTEPKNLTEAKRGVPCPVCNGGRKDD